MPLSTRKELSRRASLLLGVGLAAWAEARARAATAVFAPDCEVTGSGWGCYLPGIFHFLLALAVILGLVLLAVIGVAVRSYFKIKRDGKVGS